MPTQKKNNGFNVMGGVSIGKKINVNFPVLLLFNFFPIQIIYFNLKNSHVDMNTCQSPLNIHWKSIPYSLTRK